MVEHLMRHLELLAKLVKLVVEALVIPDLDAWR